MGMINWIQDRKSEQTWLAHPQSKMDVSNCRKNVANYDKYRFLARNIWEHMRKYIGNQWQSIGNY
jgi:hypothetical protein